MVGLSLIKHIHFIKGIAGRFLPPEGVPFFIDMAKKKEKGVYISDTILSDSNLTMWERVLFAMICNWHESEGERELSQKWLCERFGFIGEKKNNKGNLSRYIKNLIEKGYIEKKSKGVYIPLKVIKTTTNKSCQNDNKKLSKQQPEVINLTTTHHISNIKEVKGVKEAPPPESSNSEKPNLSDDAKNATTEKPNPQKLGPTIYQKMYAVMVSMDDTHIGSADSTEIGNLKKLFFKIRDYLQAVKKKSGNPYWNAAPDEVLEHFKDFCNGLSDFIKRERFTTAYLNRHYADLRKEAMQKNRKPAKQEIKEENYYQPKKKRK
jgi:hypothetical protein